MAMNRIQKENQQFEESTRFYRSSITSSTYQPEHRALLQQLGKALIESSFVNSMPTSEKVIYQL